MPNNDRSVVVLISGNGSNLQALIEQSTSGNYKIVGVISNNPDAYGLKRAEKNQIPSVVLDHRKYESRDLFDHALAAAIDNFSPRLIVLAGFMRILGTQFVDRYQGRILNIHPSLLPDYPGINTHQRVLDAGEKKHGVSVHFVTGKLDGGPVIVQVPINIESTDTADTLANKIHEEEHIIYPAVVSWFVDSRLSMDANNIAYLDGEALPVNGTSLATA